MSPDDTVEEEQKCHKVISHSFSLAAKSPSAKPYLSGNLKKREVIEGKRQKAGHDVLLCVSGRAGQGKRVWSQEIQGEDAMTSRNSH